MSGRKTKVVAITVDGRDKGKHFLIYEMPASAAEEWAMQALLLAAQSGAQIPPDVMGAGMAGLAVVGIQAILGGVPFAPVRELLREAFDSCVAYIPDPNNLNIMRGNARKIPGCVGPLLEEDIQEVATRIELRKEIFLLHTGFSMAEGLLNLTSGKPSAKTILNTQISQGQSRRSSQRTRQRSTS